MNLSNLLQPTYWFAEAPLLTPLALRAMLIFFGALVIAAIILQFKSGQADSALARGLRQMARLCVGLGLFGLVILFFRYQFVPVLSRRFIYLVWLGVALAGATSVLRYFVKQMPARRLRQEEARRKEKYLP